MVKLIFYTVNPSQRRQAGPVFESIRVKTDESHFAVDDDYTCARSGQAITLGNGQAYTCTASDVPSVAFRNSVLTSIMPALTSTLSSLFSVQRETGTCLSSWTPRGSRYIRAAQIRSAVVHDVPKLLAWSADWRREEGRRRRRGQHGLTPLCHVAPNCLLGRYGTVDYVMLLTVGGITRTKYTTVADAAPCQYRIEGAGPTLSRPLAAVFALLFLSLFLIWDVR